MDFAQPLWILAGIVASLALVAFFAITERNRQQALRRFAAPQLLPRLTGNISQRARRGKSLLLVLAVFLAFLALARPQVGYQWTEVQRRGIDLLFAIDTSKSMLAEDIKPNRLERASLAILDFVRQLQGDRVGLLPFAGTASLLCPLTIDYQAFAHSLSSINVKLMPQGGTNLGAAIDMAAKTLSAGSNHKILIVLTDGEDLAGEAVAAAERAAKKGLTIHTVGVGSSRGELIPLPEGKGFVKDGSGNFVTSRLDIATLTAIAEKSGGLYVPLGPAGEGLETIYREKLSQIPKDDLLEKRQKVPIERYQWPLALALACLVLELLISERKVRLVLPGWAGKRLWPWSGGKKGGTIATLFLCLVLLDTGHLQASPGEEAYARGDYPQASAYYREQLGKKPDDPLLLYNLGAAAHKSGEYDQAIAAFGGALKSDDPSLQQKAYYNRGNSHYLKGGELQPGDGKGAAAEWRQALASYDAALALDQGDGDARHNRQVVAERLAQLEKQLQQEQQTQQDGKQREEGQEPQPNQNDGEQPQADEGKDQPTATDGSESVEDKNRDDNQQTPGQPDEQPAPANTAPASPPRAGEAEADRDERQQSERLRQQRGQMTREEAERLLNALKNEESTLNFLPSTGKEQRVDKDW